MLSPKYTKLRFAALTALLLTTSTGVVMASSHACQVLVLHEARMVQMTVQHRIHHSAATLARWKIGAQAWSKAHGGKVYPGRPARRRADWKPLTFTCDDVALDLTRPDGGLLLPGELVPQFEGYGSSTMAIVPANDVAPVDVPPLVAAGGIPLPFGGVAPIAVAPPGSGTGISTPAMPGTPSAPGAPGRPGAPGSPGVGSPGGPDAPVGPASFPPDAPTTLPPSAPTPEPPAVILFLTGVAALLLSKARRPIDC